VAINSEATLFGEAAFQSTQVVLGEINHCATSGADQVVMVLRETGGVAAADTAAV
jgi:hypothetical protein